MDRVCFWWAYLMISTTSHYQILSSQQKQFLHRHDMIFRTDMTWNLKLLKQNDAPDLHGSLKVKGSGIRSRSRSWSRRSRHISAGAGAARTFCSEPEPEPSKKVSATAPKEGENIIRNSKLKHENAESIKFVLTDLRSRLEGDILEAMLLLRSNREWLEWAD